MISGIHFLEESEKQTMATRGVPINLSKKYQTISGKKVNLSRDTYPIQAEIFTDAYTSVAESYTFDGFYHSGRQPNSLDLVEIEENVKERELEKKRKFKSIFPVFNQEGIVILHAVSDDGNVYFYTESLGRWGKFPDLPQD